MCVVMRAVPARVAVLVTRRVLARANWQKIADGRSARDVHPEAVADADQAFAQLR